MSPDQDLETELRSLASVLARQRWWALATFMLVLVATIVWVAMQPRVDYEGRAVIEMVSIPQSLLNLPLASPEEMVLKPLHETFKTYSPRVQVTVSSRGEKLYMFVRGYDRAQVAAILDVVVAEAGELVRSIWLPLAREAADALEIMLQEREARLMQLKQRRDWLWDEASKAQEPGRFAVLAEVAIMLDDHADAEAGKIEVSRAIASGERLRSRNRYAPDWSLLHAKRVGALESPRILAVQKIYTRSRNGVLLPVMLILGLLLASFVALFVDLLASHGTGGSEV